MKWLARRRRRRLERAQGELHAAIARGDQAAEAELTKKITRLLAKRT